MKHRNLGDLAVSEIGFGIMSFVSTHGASPERAEAKRDPGGRGLSVSIWHLGCADMMLNHGMLPATADLMRLQRNAVDRGKGHKNCH